MLPLSTFARPLSVYKEDFSASLEMTIRMEQLLLLSPPSFGRGRREQRCGVGRELVEIRFFPRVVIPRKQRLYAASFCFRASFIGLQGGFLDFARNDDTHGTAFTIVLSLPFRYNKEN